MALITTFMTTPLLHFVFIRYLPKSTRGPKMVNCILMAVNRVDAASWMLTNTLILRGGDNKVAVKALHLQDTDDRPSTYFFSGEPTSEVPVLTRCVAGVSK